MRYIAQALAPSAPAIALSMAIANLMMVSHFDFVSGFIGFKIFDINIFFTHSFFRTF